MRYYSSVAPQMTLQAGVTNVATSLSVDTVAGLPGTFPFTVVIDPGVSGEEIVSVTNVAALVLTVTRGQDGSTATSHSAGAIIRHMGTARDLQEPQTHMNNTAGVHGVAGSVVGTTDVQTFTNKVISGSSNTLTNIPGANITGANSVSSGVLPANTVFTTGAQTLSSKGIDGATNTLTNIGTSALSSQAVTAVKVAANVITTDQTAPGMLSANLIPNGSMEYTSTYTGGRIAGWTSIYTAGTAPTYGIDASTQISGNQSLTVSHAINSGATIGTAEVYRVNPGDTYYVEAKVKGSRTPSPSVLPQIKIWFGDTTAHLYALAGPGQTSVIAATGVNISTTAQTFSGTVTVPAGYAFMGFTLIDNNASDGSYVMTWDDVIMYRMSDSAQITGLVGSKITGANSIAKAQLPSDTVYSTVPLVTSWTPSVSSGLTVGNGTWAGEYEQRGNWVEGWFTFTLGSTSVVTGAVVITLPIAIATTYTVLANIGSASLSDSSAGPSTGRVPGDVGVNSTSAPGTMQFHGATGAVNATIPYTWAVGDILAASFRYRAA